MGVWSRTCAWLWPTPRLNPACRRPAGRLLHAARDGLLWPLAIAVVAALVIGITQTRGLFLSVSAQARFHARDAVTRRLLGTAALGEIAKNLFKAA